MIEETEVRKMRKHIQALSNTLERNIKKNVTTENFEKDIARIYGGMSDMAQIIKELKDRIEEIEKQISEQESK